MESLRDRGVIWAWMPCCTYCNLRQATLSVCTGLTVGVEQSMIPVWIIVCFLKKIMFALYDWTNVILRQTPSKTTSYECQVFDQTDEMRCSASNSPPPMAFPLLSLSMVNCFYSALLHFLKSRKMLARVVLKIRFWLRCHLQWYVKEKRHRQHVSKHLNE